MQEIFQKTDDSVVPCKREKRVRAGLLVLLGMVIGIVLGSAKPAGGLQRIKDKSLHKERKNRLFFSKAGRGGERLDRNKNKESELLTIYVHDFKNNLVMTATSNRQTKEDTFRDKREKEYYDLLEQQNHQLMIYVHDARNHLTAIQNISQDIRVQSYITKLTNELRKYSCGCHSGNQMLDIEIDRYRNICEEKEISFTFDVKTCNLSVMEDPDLVSVLGNLMDNAVTAAKRSCGKTISLETQQKNQYHVLIIKNSCDERPLARKGVLVSSQKMPDRHGMGVKSVQKVLAKYRGELSWKYDELLRVFTAIAVIPCIPEKSMVYSDSLNRMH